MQELQQKLCSRGYSASEIKLILQDLVRGDLISEARYVEMVIRSRIAKGYGPMFITSYLHEKGIAKAEIEKALKLEQQDWGLILAAAVRKKYGETLADIDFKKVMRFLLSRGFSHSQIQYFYNTRRQDL